ncbi:hypothetical protein [Paraburkholderia guartelaensis]|uniref:Uncharacterized protein n=1 Tax=Paraburkholderia guartelaensis TaxID=2546446 RepID=A0ABU9SMD7_9BURK
MKNYAHASAKFHVRFGFRLNSSIVSGYQGEFRLLSFRTRELARLVKHSQSIKRRVVPGRKFRWGQWRMTAVCRFAEAPQAPSSRFLPIIFTPRARRPNARQPVALRRSKGLACASISSFFPKAQR